MYDYYSGHVVTVVYHPSGRVDTIFDCGCVSFIGPRYCGMGDVCAYHATDIPPFHCLSCGARWDNGPFCLYCREFGLTCRYLARSPQSALIARSLHGDTLE